MANIDPKITEQFLESQPDVVNASVWVEFGRLLARVTVLANSAVTGRNLQSACLWSLGLPHTPTEITLDLAMLRAA